MARSKSPDDPADVDLDELNRRAADAGAAATTAAARAGTSGGADRADRSGDS